jgi:hypothetical protein
MTRFAGHVAFAVVPVNRQYLAGGAVVDLDVHGLPGERRQGAEQRQTGGCPGG